MHIFEMYHHKTLMHQKRNQKFLCEFELVYIIFVRV